MRIAALVDGFDGLHFHDCCPVMLIIASLIEDPPGVCFEYAVTPNCNPSADARPGADGSADSSISVISMGEPANGASQRTGKVTG
jgi:hypothetical protein